MEFFTSSLNKRRKLEGDAEEDGAGGDGGGPRKIEEELREITRYGISEPDAHPITQPQCHGDAPTCILPVEQLAASVVRGIVAGDGASSREHLLSPWGPFINEVRNQGGKLAQVREAA